MQSFVVQSLSSRPVTFGSANFLVLIDVKLVVLLMPDYASMSQNSYRIEHSSACVMMFLRLQNWSKTTGVVRLGSGHLGKC